MDCGILASMADVEPLFPTSVTHISDSVGSSDLQASIEATMPKYDAKENTSPSPPAISYGSRMDMFREKSNWKGKLAELETCSEIEDNTDALKNFMRKLNQESSLTALSTSSPRTEESECSAVSPVPSDVDALLSNTPDYTLTTAPTSNTPNLKSSEEEPIAHQVKRKVAKRVVQDSSDEDDNPVKPSTIIRTLTPQERRERMEALATDRAAAGYTKEIDLETREEVIFSEDDNRSTRKKHKAQRKPGKGQTVNIKPLTNKELAEMRRLQEEIKRSKDVELEPRRQPIPMTAFLSKYIAKGSTNCTKTGDEAAQNVGSTPSTVRSPVLPAIVASTPLEQYNEQRLHDMPETMDVSFLESQQESYDSNTISTITSKGETDPIETTSPELRPFSLHKIVAKSKRLVNLDTDDEEPPNLDLALTKHFAAKAANKPRTLVNKKGSDSDSDDLEVLPPQDTTSFLLKPQSSKLQDPRSAIDQFGKIGAHVKQEARSSVIPLTTETQMKKAAKVWGKTSVKSSASRDRVVPVHHKGLNNSLLDSARRQSRELQTRKAADFEARGGRQKKTISSKDADQGAEQTTITKNVVANFAENAKIDAANSDADDAEDDDYVAGEDEILLSGDSEADEGGTVEENGSGTEAGSEADDEIDQTGEINQADLVEETEDKHHTSSRKLLAENTISDVTTLSPTQVVGEDTLIPAPPVNKAGLQFNFGAGGQNDEVGFSQFFNEDGTQRDFAEPQDRTAIFHLRAAAPDFDQSQSLRDQIQKAEVAAPINEYLEEPMAVGNFAAPRFMNSQGFLTQTKPSFGDEERDSQASPVRTLSLQRLMSSRILEEETQSQKSLSQETKEFVINQGFQKVEDDQQIQHEVSDVEMGNALQSTADEDSEAEIDATQQATLPAEEEQTAVTVAEEPTQPKNAFDLMKEAQYQTTIPVKRKKMMKSAFVEDEAGESDEEERFNAFGSITRKEDDEDEDGQDDDGVVENLVDDQQVEAAVLEEQNRRAADLAKQHRIEDDIKLQKRVENDTKGGWRQKRLGADVLSDGDYSSDENGESKGRKAHKIKKRKLAGGDEMDNIGQNPETRPFAEMYKETHEIKEKGEDYGFLQNPDDFAGSDDEDIEEGRVQDKVTRQQLLAEYKSYQNKRPEIEAQRQALESSSSPRKNLVFKDRTVVTRVAKPTLSRYNDDFADIDAEYTQIERVESAHQKALRAKEGQTENKHPDNFSKRAGQNSSVTNMTRKAASGSTTSRIEKKGASISSLDTGKVRLKQDSKLGPRLVNTKRGSFTSVTR